MRKIAQILEEENPQCTISKEDNIKYDIFRKWLIDNGVKFQSNFTFPHSYGPFNIIGCKTKRDIPSNEAFLYVPSSLMILSTNYEYLIPKLLTNDDDLSTLALTLFLITENQKGDKSFYKPLLDIYPNQDYLFFWDEKAINDLNNEKLKNSIRNISFQLNEYYNKIIKDDKYKSISRFQFTTSYCHVLSRQFYIDDYTSAFVPGGDLFNHSSFVNIRYEIFDSENYVYKYTLHLCNQNDFDIIATNGVDVPYHNASYNRYQPIKLNSNDENDDHITLNINDYFVLATSYKMKFKKDEQLYSNYSAVPNKDLLKYYGFNLLFNKYDYTLQTFVLERGKDLIFEKYMELIFGKRFKTQSDPIYNLLKIKVKYNSVCYDLVKYYRFMFFLSKRNIKDFMTYDYDLTIEKDSLSACIEMLTNSLNELELMNTIDNDLNRLEEMIIYKKDLNQRRTNIIIFRLTQRINLAHQIDLIKAILNLLNKYSLKDYNEVYKHKEELKNISEYDSDENCITKIEKFINKTNNNK